MKLSRSFRNVRRIAAAGRQQNHFGGPIPDRTRLPERLQVSNQDRRVHQRHEMRTRAAGERDRLSERQ